MKVKTKKPKVKKFSITLPEREGKLLKMYADDYGITRPAAIRKMVREGLKQYRAAKGNIEPDNQLTLFDSLQMDIFSGNNTIDDSE